MVKYKLLKFEASWCVPCKVVSFHLEKLKPKNPNVEFISIDQKGNEDKFKEHGIRSVPTLVLQDPEGNTIRTMSGVMSASDIENFINK